MRGQIIRLFSKACRGVLFTSLELSGGISSRMVHPMNLPRTEDQQSTPPLQRSISSLSKSIDSSSTEWAYFIFSLAALSALKSIAPESTASGFVSTDDVLSALILKAVTQARHTHLNPKITESSFDRLMDMRKHLNMPSTLIGNVVDTVTTTCGIEDSIREPLGATASRLVLLLNLYLILPVKVNASLQKNPDQHATKSKETLVIPPRTKVPPMDIKMSSCAKESCYELDLGGLLNKPVAVRRPNFEAWEGLAYLLPKKLDGELAAALCLREDDMQRMKADAEFESFGNT